MSDILPEAAILADAVKAVRMLLPLAVGNLQTVFDHTRDVIDMFGHPGNPSIERARATEKAWCDAIAAGQAVLDTAEKAKMGEAEDDVNLQTVTERETNHETATCRRKT